MEDFDDFLLRLYADARELGPHDFHSKVLSDIKKTLDFGSAFWCNGRVSTNRKGIVPTALHLEHLDLQFLLGWSEMIDHDPTLTTVTANPLRATSVRVPDTYRAVPEAIDLGRRSHIRSFTVILMPGLEPQEVQFLSLYRPDLDAQCSQSEKRWLEQVAPHLAEAWRVQQAIHPRQSGVGGYDSFHVAVADRQSGEFMRTEEGFRSLIATSWPQFDGRRVPTPLVQAWQRDPTFLHLTRKARFDGYCQGPLVHLFGRPKLRVETLSQRQLEVGRLFAAGMSHKEIGRRCDLSPTTVRNHLSCLYKSLGVHDKVELGDRLNLLLRGTPSS